MNNLDALNLPLTGRHLIEASAGTGKTYNITLLYVRLIVERKLSVQSILVVTFTRAATEELKGRICAVLRSCLSRWGSYSQEDGFFYELQQKTDQTDAIQLLEEALLNLDEAAVYTIHGFCKQALTQRAFETGMTFDAKMEADTLEIKLEAVRDWYRLLAASTENYLLVNKHWDSPEKFLSDFHGLISSRTAFSFTDATDALNDFATTKQNVANELSSHHEAVIAYIDGKCGTQGIDEFHKLTQWLQGSAKQPPPEIDGQFFKYMTKVAKPWLTPLKELCDSSSKGPFAKLEKILAIDLAASAIHWCRKRIAETKIRQNVFDFDDLIYSLHQALHDLPGKDRLKLALQQQYPVALVDEFQDTDQAQFDVFDAIYSGNPDLALFMIGDPKQAIYGFRGGDVFAYLNARKAAEHHWFMDTNWRSTHVFVTAYNRLFSAQGHPSNDAVFRFGIEYAAVKSSGKADEKPLICGINALNHNNNDDNEHQDLHLPLALIYFPPHPDFQNKKAKKDNSPNTKPFQSVIAQWCATEISRLLHRESCVGTEPLTEKDIAILVRNKGEAEQIQKALTEAGHASVYLSARDNVFTSPEAAELFRLLSGILELENSHKMTAALSTPFFGLSNEKLAALTDDEVLWEHYRDTFLSLREQWSHQGIMPMVFGLMESGYQPDQDTRERTLTNTLHLLELLQSTSAEHAQPESLMSWFEEELHNPTATSVHELRLESDDNLIQIVTQHGSKGLEYPIVFVPFSSYYGKRVSKALSYTYHDRTDFNAKSYLGEDSALYQLYEEEQQAEDVRLLYVAVTRAIYRCYLPVTPFGDCHLSPIGLMLRLDNGEPETILQALMKLQADEPEAISLHSTDAIVFTALSAPNVEASAEANTGVQTFSHHLNDLWRIHSFSSLSHRQLRGLPTRTLRDPELENAEPLLPDQSSNAMPFIESPEMENPCPSGEQRIRFEFPKGAEPGNLLHSLLETVHFSAIDWMDCEDIFSAYPHLILGRQDELTQWLESCLHTVLPCGISLSQLSEEQTLKESEFYFDIPPLAVNDLFTCLTTHRQQTKSATEPLWLNRVTMPTRTTIQGMMCGFVDLIFECDGRYYIADYKSTFLGDNVNSYQHEALLENIESANYDLQFLIYSLALHRYLRQRITNYSPEQHLGGVYYLYLRGLQNSDDVDGCSGIYSTRVDPLLIEKLDALFIESDNIQHSGSR